jgi:hypothetical protein
MPVKTHMVYGPLQKISQMYRNSRYIADKVFPIIDGCSPRSQVFKYNKGDWFRDEAAIRAPSTEAKRGTFKGSMEQINTKEYAFASEVTEEDRRDAKFANTPPLKPDQDAVEYATDRVDLKKEKRVAELVMSAKWSDVNGGKDVAGAWAAGTSNTFIEDIEEGIEQIRSQTGMRPNCLLLSANVLPQLKQESSILDRIKYTERGIVTADLIASMFDLEEVLVGDAVENTAKEKKTGTDFSAKDVWEKNKGKGSAFLYYRPKSVGLKTLSAGYQARVPYDNGVVRRVSKWIEESRHQEVYEVAEETDIFPMGLDLGMLYIDVIKT